MKRVPRIEKMIDGLGCDDSRVIVCKHTGAQNEETKSSKEKALTQHMHNRETHDNTRGDDNDLNFGNRNLRRLQILNSKLMSELTDVKLSEESYLQKYENEKNMRQMLEKKYVQLETNLADNGKKIETMSRELEQMRKEFEKFDQLRIAVMFTKGALDLKLDDAEHMLRRKYEEVDVLRSHLEDFLEMNCNTNLTEEVKEAEVLLKALAAARCCVKVTSFPRYSVLFNSSLGK